VRRQLILVPLVLAGIALLLWQQSRRPEFFVSGIIEADDIRVGSRVGGRVATVLAREGETVRAGQVIAELEPFDLLAQRAEAEGRREAAARVFEKMKKGPREEEIAAARAARERVGAVLDRLKAGKRPLEIEVLKDQLRVARADLEKAQSDHQRIVRLSGTGTVAGEELDTVRQKLAAAEARVSLSEHELALAEEGSRKEEIAEAQAAYDEASAQLELLERGYRPEEIAQAEAELRTAEAAVAAIQHRLDELKIIAPSDSVIEVLELRPGDLIPANAPVVTLVDMSRLYVRAYVPEDRLDLRVGRAVKVRVDAFKNREFDGTIAYISRGAEFMPSNVQTAEERIKQVFRIKVDLADAGGDLRPGMAADVYFDRGGDAGAQPPSARPAPATNPAHGYTEYRDAAPPAGRQPAPSAGRDDASSAPPSSSHAQAPE
jgi:HlyD family secretion protein